MKLIKMMSLLFIVVVFMLSIVGCIKKNIDDIVTDTITISLLSNSSDSYSDICKYYLDKDYILLNYKFPEKVRILIIDDIDKKQYPCRLKISAEEPNDTEKTFSLLDNFLESIKTDDNVADVTEKGSGTRITTTNGTMLFVTKTGFNLPVTESFCFMMFIENIRIIDVNGNKYPVNVPDMLVFLDNGSLVKYYNENDKAEIIEFYQKYNNGVLSEDNTELTFTYLNHKYKLTFLSKDLNGEYPIKFEISN